MSHDRKIMKKEQFSLNRSIYILSREMPLITEVNIHSYEIIFSSYRYTSKFPEILDVDFINVSASVCKGVSIQHYFP